MSEQRELFIKSILAEFPQLETQNVFNMVSSTMISDQVISLPISVYESIEESIKLIYKIGTSPLYKARFKEKIAQWPDPGNNSICMSYDFHWSGERNGERNGEQNGERNLDSGDFSQSELNHGEFNDNDIKLIEVNTNASFLALSYFLYKSKGIPFPQKTFSLDATRLSIENEIHLFLNNLNNGTHHSFHPAPSDITHGDQQKNHQPICVAILDEIPSSQKMYLEFLVFNELFKRWGWSSEIVDVQEFQKISFLDLEKKKLNFIYNRSNDFYFEQSNSRALSELYQQGKVCISPHPREHFLFADKERYLDWNSLQFQNELVRQNVLTLEELKSLVNFLPKTQFLSEKNQEELWIQRKSLFFKPLNLFGGKGVYSGERISRTLFSRLVSTQNYIAQERINPGKQASYKFDLRVYTYQDQIQNIVGRLFRGQTMNLQTPGGGFACVRISN